MWPLQKAQSIPAMNRQIIKFSLNFYQSGLYYPKNSLRISYNYTLRQFQENPSNDGVNVKHDTASTNEETAKSTWQANDENS